MEKFYNFGIRLNETKSDVFNCSLLPLYLKNAFLGALLNFI